jgi:hypothetical protein
MALDAHTSMFVEARYQHIFTRGSDTQFIPVRVGLRFWGRGRQLARHPLRHHRRPKGVSLVVVLFGVAPGALERGG